MEKHIQSWVLLSEKGFSGEVKSLYMREDRSEELARRKCASGIDLGMKKYTIQEATKISV